MVPTPFNLIRTFTRTRSRRVPSHPDAVPERQLDLPVRIDSPADTARVALDLCRSRRGERTLALYLDERHHLVGHAVVAEGWVQAARLSARPILAGSLACRGGTCILVRYRDHGLSEASDLERQSAGILAAACSAHGLPVVDHVIVLSTGSYASAR